jgi:hypothetical protein
VHRARRGTKLVPIEAVEAVSPLRRVIYLRRRRSALLEPSAALRHSPRTAGAPY